MVSQFITYWVSKIYTKSLLADKNYFHVKYSNIYGSKTLPKDHIKKPEAHGPQWLTRVNSYKSSIQHLRLSVAMATDQNEEFAQNFYAW